MVCYLLNDNNHNITKKIVGNLSSLYLLFKQFCLTYFYPYNSYTFCNLKLTSYKNDNFVLYVKNCIAY